MAGNDDSELDRKYRVLRQTLGMHAILRDRYHVWARVAEVILLACSVVFCAATFATDDVYQFLGVAPSAGRIILGFASIIAFAASLVQMLLNPKGVSERHGEAVRIWSSALSEFREAWSDAGWQADRKEELAQAYWKADEAATPIPSGNAFNSLKSKYLIGVEVSKMKSRYPGCPRFVLWMILRCTGTYRAIADSSRSPNQQEVDDEGDSRA